MWPQALASFTSGVAGSWHRPSHWALGGEAQWLTPSALLPQCLDHNRKSCHQLPTPSLRNEGLDVSEAEDPLCLRNIQFLDKRHIKYILWWSCENRQDTWYPDSPEIPRQEIASLGCYHQQGVWLLGVQDGHCMHSGTFWSQDSLCGESAWGETDKGLRCLFNAGITELLRPNTSRQIMHPGI